MNQTLNTNHVTPSSAVHSANSISNAEALPTKQSNTEQSNIVIVGAGVSGLTAAIALTKLGHKVRIIDKQLNQSQTYSKAALVNSNTIQLLQDLGVTACIVNQAVSINTMSVYKQKQLLLEGDIQYGNLPHSYILPQYQTQQCLENKLLELGVSVERPLKFQQFIENNLKNQINVLVNHQKQEADTATDNSHNTTAPQTIVCNFLIGADGFNSKIRDQLNPSSPRQSVPTTWLGVDVTADFSFKSEVNLFLQSNGIVISFKMQHGYRLTSSSTEALEEFYANYPVISESWRAHFMSEFNIVKQYNSKNIFLVGDSAHVESLMGGRGLNHGIADAVELAYAIDKTGVDKTSIDKNGVNNKSLAIYQKRHHPPLATWVKHQFHKTLLATLSTKTGTQLSNSLEHFVNIGSKVNAQRTINTLFYQLAGIKR